MHRLDYKIFLDTISKYFEIRRFRDYAKPAGGKVCLLRHDVDFDIDQAIKMAEIEYEVKVRSTYFVLHTAEYYKEPNFIERCRYLQDMGHEVGLHNNIITVALERPYEAPAGLLAQELAFLRDNGIDVRGTASHGDPRCHDLNYINYQIFKGCEVKNRPDGVAGIEFYKINMADHNLDYEACWKRNCYLSDSGGTWWWCYPKKGEFVEEPKESQDVITYINSLGIADGDFTLQILAHPIWWEL